MGDMFIGIAVGIGLGALVALLRARWAETRRGASAEAMPPAAGESDDPAARLQVMSAELMAIGEASAHPREVGSNPLFRHAVALLAAEPFPLSQVIDYAVGANWMLSAAALAALGLRPDRQQAATAVARQFRHLRPWPVFYALQFFLTLEERPAAGSLTLGVPDYWIEHPFIPTLVAEHLVARAALGDAPAFGGALPEATSEELDAAETLLRAVRHPDAQALLDELRAFRRQALDRKFLESVGRFVERDREHDLRIEHEAIRQPLAAAAAFLLSPPFRSTLVVGEPRVGKSTFVMLLLVRAMERGWTVFEAGAAEPDVRAAVLRPARRADEPHDRRARRREAGHLVRPRRSPPRHERHPPWAVGDAARTGAPRRRQPAAWSSSAKSTPTGLTALLERFPA